MPIWRVQRHAAGEQCAHPDDALAPGVLDGALIMIFNDRGRLTCRAKPTTDITRGVVAVHGGYWRNGKAAVNALAGAEVSNIGLAPAFSDIAVEVAPV